MGATPCNPTIGPILADLTSLIGIGEALSTPIALQWSSEGPQRISSRGAIARMASAASTRRGIGNAKLTGSTPLRKLPATS